MTDASEFQQVTVAVPTSRLGEFHVMYGKWLDDQLSETSTSGGGAPSDPELRDLAAWGSSADDEKIALLLWGKLSGPAKSILRVLMSEPETEFSGEQLAERCGIEKGIFGVAGALGWPGRYSAAMGHKHPVQYREAQDGLARYSMAADVAKLFLAADEEAK